MGEKGMTGDDGMKGEKGFPGKTLATNVIAELSMRPSEW